MRKPIFCVPVLVNVLVAVTVLLAARYIAAASLSKDKHTSGRLSDEPVMVIAHRACWKTAPENSLSAIENCIALGVDMVEIDVRQTADGELVVIHDKTLQRTTNGKGRVSALSLAELKQLKLRQERGGEAPLTDESIPTLEQALSAAKGRILVNIDVKDNVWETAQAIVEKMAMEGQVVIKSNLSADDKKLRASRFVKTAHYMPVLYQCGMRDNVICAPVLSKAFDAYAVYSPIAYEVVYQSDNYLREGIDSMAGKGARLWVNTLGPLYAAGHDDASSLQNPDAHWGHLIDMGVNMIQTDYPSELINYLRQKGVRTQ